MGDGLVVSESVDTGCHEVSENIWFVWFGRSRVSQFQYHPFKGEWPLCGPMRNEDGFRVKVLRNLRAPVSITFLGGTLPSALIVFVGWRLMASALTLSGFYLSASFFSFFPSQTSGWFIRSDLDKKESHFDESVQISMKGQRVGLMDKSLVVCLLTSGAPSENNSWDFRKG